MDKTFEEHLVDAYRHDTIDRAVTDEDGLRLAKVRKWLMLYPPPNEAGGFLLVVREAGIPFWFSLKPETVVGRQNADLVLEHPWVSNRHALIRSDDTDWQVVDLESKNGFTINGARKSDHFLREGDIIQIGAFLLVFATGESTVEHN